MAVVSNKAFLVFDGKTCFVGILLLQQHGSDDSYRKPVQAKEFIKRLRPDIAVRLRSV